MYLLVLKQQVSSGANEAVCVCESEQIKDYEPEAQYEFPTRPLSRFPSHLAPYSFN